ncbi:MAG: hypothetical protein IJ005_02955, partial [Bacteroidales bacterium]|nr:hypothetical protein [Bacteroidales bacterium]
MKRYVSTRVIFLMDVCLSCVSSLISMVVSWLVMSPDTLSFPRILLWISFSTFSSALLIYGLKTYRIIIRHMTIRQLGSFAVVAAGSALFAVLAYALL